MKKTTARNLRFAALATLVFEAAVAAVNGAPDEVIEPVQPTLFDTIVEVHETVPPAPKSLVTDRRHLLVMGDSEACAVRPYVQKEADRASQKTKSGAFSINVSCMHSTTISQWSQHDLFTDAIARYPETDTVLVFLGTNDYGATVTPPVEPILQYVRSHGLACVWVGPVLVKGHGKRVNELLRVAVSQDCTYFDTQAMDHLELYDGIHPTPNGAVAWLRAVWPLVLGKRKVSL